MKLSKRLICLLFATIFILTCSIGIFANNLIIESSDLIQIETDTDGDELTPMASRSCGVVPRYADDGSVYSVSFYDSLGRLETRIDYQGKPHFIDGAYRLPHQHNYTYHTGPNGNVSRTEDVIYLNLRAW